MGNSDRYTFIENLRIFAIFMVVFHHAARAYATWGPWPIKEAVTSSWFDPFFAVNYGFLMALFFFISAYFMPTSFNKKGAKEFANQRNRKFLVPLIFFVLMVIPLEQYAYFIYFRDYGYINFGEYLINYYFGFGEKPLNWSGPSWPDIQLAHIWFIEHLLFYQIIYQVYRTWKDKKTNIIENIQYEETKCPEIPPKPFIMNMVLILIIFLLSIAQYFIRILYPMNLWTSFFFVFQVEPAHWLQYITVFLLGVYFSSKRWFFDIIDKIGKLWLIIGLLCIGIIYVLRIFILDPLDNPILLGNGTIFSFHYSLLETFLCFGMIFGLFYLFKKYLNKNTNISRVFSKNSFLIYLIHQPIIVFLQYFFYSVYLSLFTKFLIVGIIGSILSIGFSIILRKYLSYIRHNL